MSDDVNPLAPHVLPSFITAPNATDALLVGVGVFLVVVVFLIGIGFFWLHSLPDRMAHKGHKIQFEIVAVLCLLSLLTHNNALWGAALILALIDFPDVGAPLGRIAGSLERMARGGGETAVDQPGASTADAPAAAKPEATRSVAETAARDTTNEKTEA